MSTDDNLLYLLRNVTVRRLHAALLRDGFTLRRQRGSGRIYTHPDGRITNIHYHGGGETLPRGTLGSVLQAVGWTAEDARRLRLL